MPYSARQVSILQDERTNDPLGRSYSGMSNAAFLASVTAENRSNPRTSFTAGELFEAIVPSEFQALTAAQQRRVDRLLGLGADIIIGPGNSPQAVQELLTTFGGGSATVQALAALRNQQQSRASEIGLPNPSLQDVGRTS